MERGLGGWVEAVAMVQVADDGSLSSGSSTMLRHLGLPVSVGWMNE